MYISHSQPQEGVNMEDVLVLILATIEVLSRDRTNRNLIGKYDIIPIITRVRYLLLLLLLLLLFTLSFHSCYTPIRGPYLSTQLAVCVNSRKILSTYK